MKKSNLISIALILSLGVAPVFASNSLVQMDLKRTSADSVDVTLFTSNQFNDNVLVRKKSDNKYVLLVPKVQSAGFSNANFSNVKDVISDIDVKNINDTTGGYTKVTLITTKPLNIKTRTQKSAPVTKEQEEYNVLMAQANSIKNNISKEITTVKKVEQPKTTKATPQHNSVNNAKKEDSITAKVENKPVQEKKLNTQQPKKVEVQSETKNTANSEIIQKQNRKEYLQRLISDSKEEEIVSQVPETTETVDKNVQENIQENVQELAAANNTSLFSKIKHKLKSVLPSKKTMMFIIPLLVLIALLKSLKNAGNNVNYEPYAVNRDKDFTSDEYKHITDNNNLSWQEKYNMYVGKEAIPVKRAADKGEYTFIKTLPPSEELEDKRAKLEEMIQDLSYITESEVQSEDEVIHRAIKFKAFDNGKSLNVAKRGVKSRFKKYENEIPLKENVELGESILHTNKRSLKDANLKVSDVDTNRIKYEPKEYIMSSVDEYFSLLDKEEQQTVKAEENIQEVKSKMSNPLKDAVNQSRDNLIVKSKFDIDSEKSLYIVNKDGKNSLVGKIKDEVFVLKNFDSNVTSPIQVRHDNANVYMVKADKFKSLVEVNEDKMGVLIEL